MKSKPRSRVNLADTTPIKNEIEPYVRKWLARTLGASGLKEASVALLGGEFFKFDAVSRNENIVACVLSNRAKTVNGNENTGGVRKALNDVQALGLIPHDCRRLMVFTNQEFRDLIKRRSARYISKNIEFLNCKLPPDLQRTLDKVLDESSRAALKPTISEEK